MPQVLVLAATTEARPLASTAPHVPVPIAQVVDRGLAFEKHARWPTANAMRAALLEAHRIAFGVAPRPLSLDAIFAAPRPSAFEGAPVPAAQATQTAPWSVGRPPADMGEPVVGIATEQPVAAIKTQSVARRRRAPVAISIASVVALLVLVVAMIAGSRFYSAAKQQVTAASATAQIATASAIPSVSHESPSPLRPAVSAAFTPIPETPAIAFSDLPRMPAVAPAPSATARYSRPSMPAVPAPVASPRASAHPNPPANCNPPYYYDSDGFRIFKKECL